MSRALHGLSRALASHNQLDQAMDAAQAALKESPRDAEIHHTVGAIYERMRRYERGGRRLHQLRQPAAQQGPQREGRVVALAGAFLQSFGEREPIDLDDRTADQLHTVDFRLVNDKVIVKARVNNERLQDFVLDTGSENTMISRQTASSTGVRPITYTLSAGRGRRRAARPAAGAHQLARDRHAEAANVPVHDQGPRPLRGLPKRETESFSPLALGMSMIIDYETRSS